MGLLITTYANLVNVWKTSGKAGKQRVKDTEPSVYPDTLTSEQRMFLSSLEVDEDELREERREKVQVYSLKISCDFKKAKKS